TVTITDSGGQSATATGAAFVTGPYQGLSDGPVSLASGDGLGGSLVYSPDYEAGSGLGFADATSGVYGGYLVSGPGSYNLNRDPFTGSALGTDQVDVGTTFAVTETFQPLVVNGSPVSDLFEISVSVRNISAAPVHLLLRCGEYDNYQLMLLSNQAGDPQVVFDDNEGQYLNPLLPEATNGYPQTGDFTGVAGDGATFQLDFGTLAPQAVQTLALYRGAAANLASAQADLSTAGINTWSIAEPEQQQGAAAPDPTAPAFILGFKPGTQFSADMQVDANNDGTINAADESIKDNPSDPGKVIVANTLDESGSNEPGYADFNTSRALYDMSLTIALSNLDPYKAKVRFEYSAADPSLVKAINVPGSDIPKYDPGSTGYLRLWSTDAGRDPRSVANGGNYIPPDTALSVSNLD